MIEMTVADRKFACYKLGNYGSYEMIVMNEIIGDESYNYGYFDKSVWTVIYDAKKYTDINANNCTLSIGEEPDYSGSTITFDNETHKLCAIRIYPFPNLLIIVD